MATHVSFPLFIPFIIFISMKVGAPFVGDTTDYSQETLDLAFAKAHLLQYLVGSIILAVSSALVLGTLTYVLLESTHKTPKKPS